MDRPLAIEARRLSTQTPEDLLLLHDLLGKDDPNWSVIQAIDSRCPSARLTGAAESVTWIVKHPGLRR